jgi:chromosome segregation and condensation protein ScpB
MHSDDIPINSLIKGGRSKNIIGPLKEGELVSKGYKATSGRITRRRALAKAVRAYGRLSTLRKLNAIAVLTKRRSPGRSKTFKTDRNWVKKTYF